VGFYRGCWQSEEIPVGDLKGERMKKKVTKSFPFPLYVWLEEDGDVVYPIPETDLDEISVPDGTEIGIYILQRVGQLKKTITIE